MFMQDPAHQQKSYSSFYKTALPHIAGKGMFFLKKNKGYRIYNVLYLRPTFSLRKEPLVLLDLIFKIAV